MQTEATTTLISENIFCDKVFRVQLIEQDDRTPQIHIQTWQVETGATALRLRNTVKLRPYVAQVIRQAIVRPAPCSTRRRSHERAGCEPRCCGYSIPRTRHIALRQYRKSAVRMIEALDGDDVTKLDAVAGIRALLWGSDLTLHDLAERVRGPGAAVRKPAVLQ